MILTAITTLGYVTSGLAIHDMIITSKAKRWHLVSIVTLVGSLSYTVVVK